MTKNSPSLVTAPRRSRLRGWKKLIDKLQASRISGGNSACGRAKSDFYPTPPEPTKEARERIVRLIGDVERIELFARERVPGWDAWGNEV